MAVVLEVKILRSALFSNLLIFLQNKMM